MQIPKRKGENNKLDDFDPYLTRKKYQQLQADKEKMIKIIRPKLVHEVQELAKLGDFSENAAYQIAKGKLRGLNHRLLVIEEKLKQAIIIDDQPSDNKIRLGSQVTVELNGKKYTYQILGSQETDPQSGVISHHSPIGSALLGHKVDDAVDVNINDKIIRYKIVKVK